MRRALVALATVATGVLVWWGRGEESARSGHAAPPDAPSEREEPAAEAPEPAPGEAAPAPEAPSVRGDPVERGECAIFLRVLDAKTEQPVASTVDLWRLDAPGNGDWTAGDQLHVTAEVPAEGARLEGLPAGVYRPVCLAARYSSDDPPPFLIEGALTEVAIRAETPRSLYAYVKVVDPRGVPMPTGGVRGGYHRGWTDRERRPAWTTGRLPRGGGVASSLPARVGGRGGTRSSSTKPVPQPAEGFRLGPFPEDTKKSAVLHYFTVQVEGCGDVRVAVPGTAADGSTFLGLSVPLATVPGDLRMRDGRTIAEAGGKVSATFVAVPLDASAPAPLLSDRPFHVYVAVPGFKDLSFEHRLGEPIPSLVFEPEER
ncbi:MAG: hypothetical protein L6Q95_01755 [Planctomycetes bacterium]|nr:hypothetical protein [Planctomycetota bacterium]